MKPFGIITLAHWMSGRLETGYTAYMEHEDRLVRLERVTSDGGCLRPVFFINDSGLSRLKDEKLSGLMDTVSLSALVFLNENAFLAGVYLDDVIESSKLLEATCWASKVLPATEPFPAVSAEGELEKFRSEVVFEYEKGNMPGFWWDYYHANL